MALLVALAGLAGEAGAEDGEHAALEVDPLLDWATLLDTTLAQYPRSGELPARDAEAAAWQRRGRQWLAAAPSLYFSYLSDRALDDAGQREYEGGVELPLWRTGQRAAVRAVAESATAASGAARDALRLEVAGLLRGALWDLESAAVALAASRDAEAVAAQLVRTVEQRTARGDLARSDLLLARSTWLERQQEVVAAETELQDAERRYRSLTALDRRPAEFAEAASDRRELTPNHPLLALASAAVERARTGRELVERETRGNVSVTVGPHRERAPFETTQLDSVSLAVKVPVGGKGHGAIRTAEAGTALAVAEADLGALARRLELDLHEAEHTLAALERSLAIAATRRAVADEQLFIAESAFTQGEIELRELLRVQEATLAARSDERRLAVEQRRTIAALNQALGEIP